MDPRYYGSYSRKLQLKAKSFQKLLWGIYLKKIRFSKIGGIKLNFNLLTLKKLCRKDLMIKNLKKHRKALEKEGKNDEAA